MVVPTGVGATIGGFAGDALPVYLPRHSTCHPWVMEEQKRGAATSAQRIESLPDPQAARKFSLMKRTEH